MIKYIIYCFAFFALLVSCSNAPTKEPQKKENNDAKLEQRAKKINEISLLNNASTALDALEYRFTFQYQELINQNNLFLLSKYEIIDIVKKDSSYQLILKKGFLEDELYYLDCSIDKINALGSDIFERSNRFDTIESLLLIVHFDSVKRLQLKIDTEINTDEEVPSASIEMDPSEVFIFKGRLIKTINL